MIRARYMRTFAGAVDRLPEQEKRRVKDAVAEAVWNDIGTAGAFAWLPVETNVILTRAVTEQLGPKRAHEFFYTLMLSTFKTPLLRTLVDAVVRTLGADPGSGLVWVSKGFDIMYKNSGSWHVTERTEGAATLEVRGLPAFCVNDRIWLQSVASSLCALFTVARLEGVTTIRDVDAAAERVAFRLRWSQPR